MDAQSIRFDKLHLQRSQQILEMPADKLLDVKAVQVVLPARARVETSEPCSRCGEPTMRTKLQSVDGKKLCRGCLPDIL